MISCAGQRFQLTLVSFSCTPRYAFSVTLSLREIFPFHCIFEIIDFFNQIKMYRFGVGNYPHLLVTYTLNSEALVMNEFQQH